MSTFDYKSKLAPGEVVVAESKPVEKPKSIVFFLIAFIVLAVAHFGSFIFVTIAAGSGQTNGNPVASVIWLLSFAYLGFLIPFIVKSASYKKKSGRYVLVTETRIIGTDLRKNETVIPFEAIVKVWSQGNVIFVQTADNIKTGFLPTSNKVQIYNEIMKRVKIVETPVIADFSAPAPKKRKATSVSEALNTETPVFENQIGALKSLTVYNDYVELTQLKNARAVLTQKVFQGSKEIYFRDMISIQYREATSIILGYLQFEVPGVASANTFGGENSWTFGTDKNEIAKRILMYVRQRINEEKSKNNGPSVVTVEKNESVTDELMKLNDLYEKKIISEEEFNEAKEKLLNRL